MQIKHLITLFFLVLIVADQCSAFLSLIPSLVGGSISAFKGRRKREISAQIEQYKDLQKREAELEELLDRLPMY
uniref:Antimicrobial peptide TsAP-1 n=1 Tax=Tityus serrulatus TaxID=6887 RepID=NDB4M_TITSE|nr:RecName: Full=Antimicrobial peptide TsAP-1; AltName: Full=Non-disulfide-bridged peptide 4.22; Short=NDBP-4.22; Flags: Precursor [Tityus serrulatus]CCQ98791.1 AP1 precusor [Tityus serrulatus]